MKDDIGIYTNRKTWTHKRKDGDVFWKLAFRGKLSLEEMEEQGLEVPKRLWFAFEGRWRGYFDISGFEGNDILFHSRGWNWLMGNADDTAKPFRGFTYKVPLEELT